MLILHPYLPGHREDDQAPTWHLLETLPKHLWVHHVDLSWDRLYGYSDALRALWDRDHDWLIVEHDIEATLADVEAMERCPELLCAAPYAHSGHAVQDLTGMRVMVASLGFTRITARARRLYGDWPVPAGVTYHLLDSYLTAALTTRTGVTWHPHRPVAHHHAESMLSA